VQTPVADTRLAVDATNTDRFHAPESSTRPAAARAPTVDTPRAPGPTPTQAADRLYRAMYGGVWGFGADRRVVLEVLAALTPDALAEVRHHYRAHYGRDLDADVARKLPKRDAAKADARLRGQAELADVLTLRGALRGLRKDTATALSILERAARTGQSHAFAERFALETGTPLGPPRGSGASRGCRGRAARARSSWWPGRSPAAAPGRTGRTGTYRRRAPPVHPSRTSPT
jgi:hypothetical protein